MEDINLKELWDSSSSELPHIDQEDISEIAHKSSSNLIEQFKEKARKRLKFGVVLQIVIIIAFFVVNFYIAGLVSIALFSFTVWLHLKFYKKIDRIDYNQDVLNYLTKFRSQLGAIAMFNLLFYIFAAFILVPVLYIIMLGNLTGNSHIFPLFILKNSGYWGGLVIAEIIPLGVFLIKLYQTFYKTIQKVDQRIEELIS